ncbi:NIF family HAD-type phosphatase [Metasolibacillus meyeri]|uniref:NIF family HAD-type phosphatase n=1 Tax=Metasolibacillus meyeri TaxID=1071052 RepID=UPI000D3171E4|nr:NIF family HAD-type phosphatase [Metasolibacillus meyeri]
MYEQLKLSSLGKTWIFDLDGTLVKHNGYKIDGEDTLLEGVSEFFEQLCERDMVVIVTARTSRYKEQTLSFLAKHQIHYDHIIFDAPHGERILFNDIKPSGLKTAYSINQARDCFKPLKYEVDEDL